MASAARWMSSSAGRGRSSGSCNADRSQRSMSLPEGTWTYDPSHYPEPMTPLSADVWFWAMGLGIQAAARELRAPFGGVETTGADGGWGDEHDPEPSREPRPPRPRAAALAGAGRWGGGVRGPPPAG